MKRLLVIDNGSVYTKNLLDFMSQNKINFITTTTEQVSQKIENFDSFILSGRRKNNQKMNSINSKIIKHAIKEKKPLLGICYGAEILALTVGGTIRKTTISHKGIEDVQITKENKLCNGKLQVFESHNYEISRLGDQLVGIAESKNCKYEIIKHKELDIFGTQFHPEMSKDGQMIIETFSHL